MEKKSKEWVEEMKMRDKIDSDHQPVEVTMRERRREKNKQKRKVLERNIEQRRKREVQG